MDKKYIEQNDVIERFVLSQLTAEELDQFLVYQMLHPEIQQEIQSMRQLINSIRHSSQNHAGSTAGKKNYLSPRSGIILVLILMLISIGTWLLLNQRYKGAETVENSPLLPPQDSLEMEPKDSLLSPSPSKNPNPNPPPPPDKSSEPTNKSTEKPVIAAADLQPNNFLEINIGSNLRSETVLEVTSPESGARFIVKDVLQELSFMGKLRLSPEEQSVPQLTLYLFTNKESDYLEFKPLFSHALNFSAQADGSYDFAIEKKTALPHGLYYFLIEDEVGKTYHTGKFFVLL